MISIIECVCANGTLVLLLLIVEKEETDKNSVDKIISRDWKYSARQN